MMSTDRSALPGLAAERLSSAVLSDILDDLGHRDHVLDPAIRPLGDAAVIAGWANPFLVTEVDEIPAVPYAGEIAALDDIAPDDVVLIGAGGSARAAVWGELFSTAARVRGARGTLIDGYCRDAQTIAAIGYPVWCRGMLPLDVKGRLALSMESTASRMNRLGRSVLMDMPLLTLDETIERLDAVDAEQLSELAQMLYPPTRLSAAGIGRDEGRFREALDPVGMAA